MELAITVPGKKKTTDSIKVSDGSFGCAFNHALVHQVVNAYLAGARQGTRGQKNRSAANGGGRKPWRQKGTGNARAGTIRSPLWRGGGVTFAAKKQNHSQKVNKKMFRQAMRAVLSELIRQQRLLVVESLDISQPKTKLMVALLASMALTDTPTLIVTNHVDDNVYLAARNLPNVDVIDQVGLNIVRLVRYEKIIITKDAINALEERLT